MRASPYKGWAIASTGGRTAWLFPFTLAYTRRDARAKCVASFSPDKHPTWASLSRAYPRLRAVRVTMEQTHD